jgi:tetratricopeptide (TPR) repeat protein
MSHSLTQLAISFFLAFFLFCPLYAADKNTKKSVLFITDTIVFGNNGVKEYSSVLQNVFDKEFGKNKTEVKTYSFFDLNTSQALRLAQALLEENKDVHCLILTVGEGNFYNLNGFSGYLSYEGKYLPRQSVISPDDSDASFKLNLAMADFYNSISATPQSSKLKYSASAAYRQIAKSSPRLFNGYRAKVIPSFVLLRPDAGQFSTASFSDGNKLVWSYIGKKQYLKAEELLQEMLSADPLNSGIYYALGSLRLTSDKKQAEAALAAFEDGILTNPFDPNNKCYKALALMYMSYKGKIVNEILYFSGVLKSFIGETNPEINAICAMNSADYDDKIYDVNRWIISDVKRIDDLCRQKGVRLIVGGYPAGFKAESVLKSILYSPNAIFVDNSSISAARNSDRDKVFTEMAEKLSAASKGNNK